MLYLIWSIINILIVLYFFYLLIGFFARGSEIFDNRFKRVSILLFFVGLFHLFSAMLEDSEYNRWEKKNTSYPEALTKTEFITLGEYLTMDINVVTVFEKRGNQYEKLRSSSGITGFCAGYDWELTGLYVKPHKPGSPIEYNAAGVLKWKLFGITLYSDRREFSGTVK